MQDRLEEIRALNRANFEATGEYMTEVSFQSDPQAPCMHINIGSHDSITPKFSMDFKFYYP